MNAQQMFVESNYSLHNLCIYPTGNSFLFSPKILCHLSLEWFLELQLFFEYVTIYRTLSFPWGSAGKESSYNAGDLGLIPGFGRSPREGNGYLLQYSGLENFMNSIVQWVAKSRTWLGDFHFHLQNSRIVCYHWISIHWEM